MTGEATDLVARLQGAADSFRDQVIAIDSDGPTARLMREAATLIEAQAAEIEVLRAALQPFSVYYQINDLDERLADDAIEVPVGDLRQAYRVLTTTQEGPNP